MHFYYLASYRGNAYHTRLEKQDWFNGKVTNDTCLYEPSNEADEFIGTCLMLGVDITFIKIDTSVEVPEGKSVYIYSTNEPMVATTLTGRLVTLYPSTTSYLSSDECTL